jgi:LysM repeat protein
MEETRMFSKRSYLLLVFILIAVLLGACVRSASTPPDSLVAPPPEVPSEAVPLATNEVLSELQQLATQTAAASLGTGGEQPTQLPGSETQAAPGDVTEVPVTGATQPGGEVQPTSELVSTQPPGGDQPTAELVPTQPTSQEQSTQAPTPAAIVVPTGTPGIPKSYVIQPGEFPYCIARRFDVNPSELLSINGLSGGQIVRPGTTLKIPQTGNPFPGNRALQAHPTTYTVQGGENIYEVACKFGDVSPDAIIYANSLLPPYTLSPGQKLYIP